jgi:hypothetical protein
VISNQPPDRAEVTEVSGCCEPPYGLTQNVIFPADVRTNPDEDCAFLERDRYRVADRHRRGSVRRADSGRLDCGIAAVDEQVAPGNKTRTVAGEEDRRRRNLLWAAEPAQQVL